MAPRLLSPLLASLALAAHAGPVDDAEYLFWTDQQELAAQALEPWLAEHPDDLGAHALYLDVRIHGMGEDVVVASEYAAWKAPSAELGAEVEARLERALAGDSARDEEHPLPPVLNKRWVKFMVKQWRDDPAALRDSVDALFGLDAPIGADADALRAEAMKLVSEWSKSEDPMALEAARAAAEGAGVPGLALVALAALTERDPGAHPGLLEDTLTRKVRKAARAVDIEVALNRLDGVKLQGTAAEAQRLRHELRAGLLAAAEREADALAALESAWKADGDDANAAWAFAVAALAVDAKLDEASRAVRLALDAAAADRFDPLDEVDGLLWPEAYVRFASRRRVDLGHLDLVRVKLDRAVGAESNAAPTPPARVDAAHHLEEGKAREDRVGTRHLVQAVRLARQEGAGAIDAEARGLLERRKAFLVGGLDARVEGWDSALGAPMALRPMQGPRDARSAEGQPLTDFEITLDGEKLRIGDLTGTRVLAAVSPDCDTCAAFVRHLDAVTREVGGDTARTVVIDVTGNKRALDKFLEGADLAVEVAGSDGELPSDFVGGGTPRLFVVGPGGVVARDTGTDPSLYEIRWAVRSGLAEVANLIATGDSPASVQRTDPKYPDAAHWLGTPDAECLGRVVVDPRGRPFHVEIYDCEEPFVTASIRALRQWRFEERSAMADTLVAISYAEPEVRYPELTPASCIWWAAVDQDGTIGDPGTNCAAGTVRPGPIPWSEIARANNTRVDSSVGSMVIRNVNLAISCELALDVWPDRVTLDSDPGTCPEAVRADAVEHVRRWDWGSLDASSPTRVILRFDPPRLGVR